MALDLGFKICHLCFTTDEADTKLTSMLADDGEMAKMYQNISGCDILDDEAQHDALICPQCAIRVEFAFIFREDIRRKHFYLQHRRGQGDQARSDQAAVTPRDELNTTSLNAASSSSKQVRSDQARLQGAPVKREPESNIASLESSSSATSLKQSRPRGKSEDPEAQRRYPKQRITEVTTNPSHTESLEVVPMVQIFQEIKFELSGPEEAENVQDEVKLVATRPRTTLRARAAGSSKLGLKRLKANISKPKQHATTAAKGSFECQVCNKKIASKGHLNIHIEAIHEEIKNFSCQLCPYKCSYKCNLTSHQQRRHSNDRPFSCPSCLGSFKTSQDVVKHKRRCQAEEA